MGSRIGLRQPLRLSRRAFQLELQWRRCLATPSTAKSDPVSVSDFLQEHVKQMQLDIMKELIPQANSRGTSLDRVVNMSSNLTSMTKYYFERGGKMLRPTIALLMASACNAANSRTIDSGLTVVRQREGQMSACRNQYKIGMIAEMIHTASLVHDDVIDEANTRRGSASVNAIFGNKMSVLVGDFILARATQVLCSIGSNAVTSTMAEIIQDLVIGEFMQMSAPDKNETTQRRVDNYMEKTYRKTASLFANSCLSVAMIADPNSLKLQTLASEYGRNLGIAFQLVDDVLDFVSTGSDLGKPAAADLKLGLATGPVIFASEQFPELKGMIESKFEGDGVAEKAREMVMNSNGLDRTRQLIRTYSEEAARLIGQFPNRNEAAERLTEVAIEQVERKM